MVMMNQPKSILFISKNNMIDLIEAVKSRRVISCTYNGKKRELEVHAVGVGHDGSELIRAYQRYDEFKLFKYSKMKDVKLLNKTFFVRSRYNRHKDKAMETILAQV